MKLSLKKISPEAVLAMFALAASGGDLLGQSELLFPREQSSSWVPKYVFSSDGPPSLPGSRITWSNVLSKGDLDRDGVLDYLASGAPAGGTGRETALRVLGGTPFRDLWFGSAIDLSGRTQQGFQTLECPSGLGLVLPGPGGNTQWAVFSFPDLQFQRAIPVPSGPINFPIIGAIWAVLPAGDQNGDGWEELLLSTAAYDPFSGDEASVPILLDGATLQPVWTVPYDLDQPVVPFEPDFAPLSQDLNGDGCLDFLTWGGHQIFPFTGRWFGALSGADGTLLWAKTESLPPGVFPSQLFHSVPDLDGDGFMDVAALQLPAAPTPGRFSVLSGASGALIWENLSIGTRIPGSLSSATPYYSRIRDFGPLGDLNRDGFPELCIFAEVWSASLPNELQRVWVFDGASGAFLEVQDFQADLSPFSPDSKASSINPYIWPISDIDADGYFEWVASVHSGDPQVFDRHLAVFGMRTLLAPNSVGLGEFLELELDIPSGGLAPFHLLFSSGFDWSGGGYSLGLWDTHLAPSAILGWSQSQSSLSGALDADGRGAVHVLIPNNSSLLGSTFYAKAWIEDPSLPGQVLTMSSLVIFRVE